MVKSILGRKIGMTQIFDEQGRVVPVTVVEAGPCIVTQKKTVETDGYEAVQVGYGAAKPARHKGGKGRSVGWAWMPAKGWPAGKPPPA